MKFTTPRGYEQATLLSWPMTDEICLPNIRLWCETLEDASPRYHDLEVAKRLFGGIVCPPTMIMSWCTRPGWTPQRSGVWDPVAGRRNDIPGYPHTVGLRSVQKHSRALRIGERFNVHQFANPPSPHKTTHRGEGRQLDQYHSLQDESGNEIASWENQTLRFATPSGPVEIDEHPPRFSPALWSGAARTRPLESAADAAAGEKLGPIELPLTVKRFMKWVAATRDYFEIHHDRDYARTTGARDMYIGVHFFHGLAGRLITDWGGPRAFVREMEVVSLGRAFPGETARAAGEVVKVDRERGSVELRIEAGVAERGKLYDINATVEIVQPR